MGDLLSTNSASRRFRGKGIVIYSSCIEEEWPEILKDFGSEYVPLKACPEEVHVNKISLKVASILARVDLKWIKVISVDGSPHCLHLHHAAEEAIKVTGSKVPVEHLVVYKGKLRKVSERAVKLSRYLYKLDKLLSEVKGSGASQPP